MSSVDNIDRSPFNRTFSSVKESYHEILGRLTNISRIYVEGETCQEALDLLNKSQDDLNESINEFLAVVDTMNKNMDMLKAKISEESNGAVSSQN